MPSIREEGEPGSDPAAHVRLDPEWPVRTGLKPTIARAIKVRSFRAPLDQAGYFRFGAGGGSILRNMLAGKIHRATVTEANLNYEGSITLDPTLMDAAGIFPYELVHVLDVTNGSRLETYAIQGRRGSGEVCINGAAAHLVHEGDTVIILTYQQMSDEAARGAAPRHVYVDAQNRIARTAYGDGFAERARQAAGIV